VKIDACEVPTSLRQFHWIEYHSEDFKAKIQEAIILQTNERQQQGKPDPSGKGFSGRSKNDDAMPGIHKSNNKPVNKKRIILIAFLTITCLTIILSIRFFPAPKIVVNSGISEAGQKEKVYNFIVDYFDNVNSYIQVESFFADHVSTFYKRGNLTPQDIVEIRKSNDEFINAIHKLDKKSLILVANDNNIAYWRFWTSFVCFRRSYNKFETANVLMEFGINRASKITSIKEIKIIGLKILEAKAYHLNYHL
jgi:hypothetical protein